jgi:hypothetical protein
MSTMRKWKPKRRRSPLLSVTPLEGRVLLTTASWVNQYLQPGDPMPYDFTAWSNQLGGDGIQDAHIALSGLPQDKSITSIDINRYGGGDWSYNFSPNNWQAALKNYTLGSSTADLFFQPFNNITPNGGSGTDSGSQYTVNIFYSDGSFEQVQMTNGYTYNDTLLMPSERCQVSWDGQVDGLDLTGPGVGVGPDGIQDDRLTLQNLAHPENPDSSTSYPIRYVSVVGPTGSGLRWESNLNLDAYANAELVTGPSSDHLYINPVVSTGPSTTAAVTQGQTLTVTVHYLINGVDVPDVETVTVGATNSSLATSVPRPGTVKWNVPANWVGQDPASSGGLVHVHLANLKSTIRGAELSDQEGSTWTYGTLGPNTLGVSQNGTSADLTFAPTRNENSATLTLRLDFGGGSVSAAQFAGSTSDPGLTVPNIAGTTDSPMSTAALLQDIQNGVGTIYLSGTYNLTQPLVLNQPVTITVQSGSSATLNFSQPETTPSPVSPWEDAIAVEANHVTLNGFNIGFTGPIRWNWTTSFGPSVIKSVNGNYLSDSVTNLTVQGPSQDVFDGSDSSSGTPPLFNVFADNFSSGSLSAWTAVGGTWTVSNGVLSQTDSGFGTGSKRLVVNTPSAFPTDMQITAQVELTSALSGDAYVGVGLNSDSSGNGYKLVFHNTNGTLGVQLLNDQVGWSGAVNLNSQQQPWTMGTWYNFKLLVMKDSSGIDTLFGKVWPVGTSEPGDWTITQTGWSRATGAPSLDGGTGGMGGGGTAAFQNVNVTTLAPQHFSTMFTDNFSGSAVGTAWTAAGGQWSVSNGVLSQTNNLNNGTTAQKLVVNSLGTLPVDMQVVAVVQPTSSPTGDGHVGIGLDGDGSGNGYSLVFHYVNGVPSVQLLNDGVGWGPSVPFSWTTNTLYFFKLLVIKDPNGVATVYGKVWADGTGEPGNWMVSTTGWSRANGAPFLDGGSGGGGTASFQDVNVTTAATSSLNLITMVNVGSGQITGNILTGGQIEVSGGPWNISNNVYNGTLANTTNQAFLALYNTASDLTALNNQVSQDNPAGKTFRFFNFGGMFASGANDVFQGNVINGGIGMGRHSGDLDWNGGGYGLPNAPEFMLTEGYLPEYEGTPAYVSTDGRVLKLNTKAMLGPYTAGTGDFVAIVSGPSTIVGKWYRIAQEIDATTYLMDQALPRGSYVIALAHGYSNLKIGGTGVGQGNSINIQGSDSTDFSLGGYEFGTQVVGNHFIGGGDSIGLTSGFNIGSFVTQDLTPFPWGWTHTPEFGIAVDSNTFEDLVAPGVIRVDHSTNPQWWNDFIKSNAGRVYYTGEFNNNTFKYNNPIVSPITGAIVGTNTVDVNGNLKAADPGELVLTASGNTKQVPSSYTGQVVIEVDEGTVNGQATTQKRLIQL